MNSKEIRKCKFNNNNKFNNNKMIWICKLLNRILLSVIMGGILCFGMGKKLFVKFNLIILRILKGI